MPLPSVVNGAKLCQGVSKRTKLPCKNPAAFGCRTCRMHGAHRRHAALSGKDHPNFKHGKETYQAKVNRGISGAVLLLLRDLGDRIGMFNGTHTPGRKPKAYIDSIALSANFYSSLKQTQD